MHNGMEVKVGDITFRCDSESDAKDFADLLGEINRFTASVRNESVCLERTLKHRRDEWHRKYGSQANHPIFSGQPEKPPTWTLSITLPWIEIFKNGNKVLSKVIRSSHGPDETSHFISASSELERIIKEAADTESIATKTKAQIACFD
jgi:hypothetical protein